MTIATARSLLAAATIALMAAPCWAVGIDPDRGPDALLPVNGPYRTTIAEAVRADAQREADILAGRRAPDSPLVDARVREVGRRWNVKPRVRGSMSVVGAPWHGLYAKRNFLVEDAIYFAPPAFTGRQPLPNAPQTINASFIGVGLSDESTGYIPPDTNGAVGPNHFMIAINGAVAFYSRAGAKLAQVSLESLFGNTTTGGAFDPRIIYDRLSGRWMLTVLEFNSSSANNVFLAVSNTSDPTGGWTYWELGVGAASNFTDFDTLGVDDNGVYIAVTKFDASNNATGTILALPKAQVLAASGVSVYPFAGLTDMWGTAQPLPSLTAVGASGAAWFAGTSTTVYANAVFRKITWSAGVPTLSASVTVATPSYGAAPNAKANGSTTDISTNDDRIQMGVRRGNRLWITRNVGTNAAGAAGSTRCSVEWLEMDVSGATPTVFQSGRVYDAAASDPRMYYYPAIAVNGQGHVALGFSGSKSTEYVAAYTCGRLATDAAGAMQAIATVKAGAGSYNQLANGINRWGDYSYTSVDPNNDMGIWTVQEYARGTNNWGTWVAELRSPAPTAANPSATATQGQSGASFTLTGTGFFDPGAGFTGRLGVAITGGSPNGVSGIVATVNSPTSVTVTYNVAADAQAATRNIVVTNPDGQSATVTGGLTISATKAASKLIVVDRTGNYTDTVVLKANLYRSSDNAMLGSRSVSFAIAGTAVGSATTDATGLAALNWAITSGAASRTIGADFAGDAGFLSCTGSATLTSTVQPTKVYVVDRLNVKIKTYTVLKADLYTTANVILPGRTLTMSVDGTSLGSQVTNGSGYISYGYTVPEGVGAGNRVIGSSWAGNAGYPASSNTGKLGVVQGNLYIWPYIRSGKRGTIHPLKGYVRSLPDYVIQPGKSITFKVNGSVIGSANVATDGWATVNWTIPAGEPTGAHTGAAEFAGDAWYAAVTASTTFNVVL
ncbi:MAG: Ig-like domain-containing protein [Armatimonadetes bacterium]|nr:Ig-like domain-containing protein [Armatimonadota bacterium]